MNNYFNTAASGLAVASSHNPTVPKISVYDKVTFYAQEGCVLDKIYGVNRILTREEIDENSTPQFSPKWEPDVYLICEFNGGISGGNVENITSKVKKWLLYRGLQGASSMKLVSVLEANETFFKDFTASKTHNYQYRLFAQTENEMSVPMDTNVVYCNYFGWFLIDEENQVAYSFGNNLEDTTISQVEDVTEYSTNKRFSVHSRGNMDYLSGSVTAVVTDNCSAQIQTVEHLEELRNFILSDCPKIVKDNKGRAFYAFVDGYTESDVFNGADGDFKYITFNFKEIEEL